MAHSPHRQWQGCALCKMHKGNGDAVRGRSFGTSGRSVAGIAGT